MRAPSAPAKPRNNPIWFGLACLSIYAFFGVFLIAMRTRAYFFQFRASFTFATGASSASISHSLQPDATNLILLTVAVVGLIGLGVLASEKRFDLRKLIGVVFVIGLAATGASMADQSRPSMGSLSLRYPASQSSTQTERLKAGLTLASEGNHRTAASLTADDREILRRGLRVEGGGNHAIVVWLRFSSISFPERRRLSEAYLLYAEAAANDLARELGCPPIDDASRHVKTGYIEH